MEKILDFWPFDFKPRKNQELALEWLQEQTVPYLIIEAPVGSGKSNIGLTYSQSMGRHRSAKNGDSFILTPQRILQQQYEQSVSDNDKIDMASFYGKGNYTCRSKNSTCEIGSIVKPRCDRCPFQAAKTRAQKAADTVLNYRLALTSFAYASTFSRRQLIVLDECHTLEQHLVDFDAFRVHEGRCKKYNLPFKATHKIIDKAHEWVNKTYLPKLKQVVFDLEEKCEPLFDKAGSELTKAEINTIRELGKLQEHLDETVEIALTSLDVLTSNYVLVWDKVMFQFKRLTAKHAFHNIVKPFAYKYLFMSSTILNKDGFCDDLGIPKDQTAFLSLPSEFDVTNRPVVYMPQTKMNAKWKEPENAKGRKNMLNTIEQLLDIHKNDSGIIHTGNFEVATWLVENLEVDHKVYHHNPDVGDDRNSVILSFQSDPKPSVLISPSSTEGLDLKDDLGRFAVFCKIPFGYLGDQWIRRRMEMSSEWYQRRALIDVIQGGGRIVRTPSDHGYVYILDQSWAYLFKSTQYMIPRWWRESYTIM